MGKEEACAICLSMEHQRNKVTVEFNLFTSKCSYIEGCRCNGKTVRRNEKILDGECNSVRRIESKVGAWKYWCYVDPGEDCEDTQDGWSFRACSGGNTIPEL